MQLRKTLVLDMGSSEWRLRDLDTGKEWFLPNLVIVDESKNRIVAVGKEALAVADRLPRKWAARRPISDGVISAYRATKYLCNYLMNQAGLRWGMRTHLYIAVPINPNPMHVRILHQIWQDLGVGEVEFIPHILAVAATLDLPVTQPQGLLAGVIGAELSEFVLFGSGGRLRQVGLNYGASDIEAGEAAQHLKGYQPLVSAIEEMLRGLAPTLSKDVLERGIVLAGGGALLPEIADTTRKALSMPIHVVEKPRLTVLDGLAAVARKQSWDVDMHIGE